LATVTMKELLEAGVHFGHQVRRWNPKMKEYIFGERNGIYIIDLQKTQRLFKEAVKFVTQQAMDGKSFMFVGTKRQAQDAVEEEAKRCGQYYVNQRWLGGLLTNFQTVQKSIQRMKDIEAMRTDGRADALTKKERLGLDREHAALEKNLAGIRDMRSLPHVIFIIDSNKEEIAVHEANKLGIATVAIVDTNCSPDGIDYIVPGNDDALRAVRLFAAKMADAIIEGQQMLKEGGAEIGEIAEGAEAAASPETPREKSERRERGRGRGDRRGQRRTTYVPPGAPPMPEPAVAVAHETPRADAASAGVEAGEAPSTEATPATVEAVEASVVGIESLDTAPLEMPEAVETASDPALEAPKAEKAEVGE
jgi:small subunit ribosomal protein S2